MLRHHVDLLLIFFFKHPATTEIYTLSLHDALPIYGARKHPNRTWSHKGPLRRRRLPPITPCGWRSKPVWLDSVPITDRKSTRLNSSHSSISYAVFCLKKKKTPNQHAYTITHTPISH